MTATLFVSLFGIAILDSLNPSLFIAQFYLFTTPKPAWRILSYIGGILTVNFIGGLLILGGFRAVISEIITDIQPNTMHLLQLLLGIALIVFAMLFRPTPNHNGDDVARKPRNLGAIYAFAFGMLVMLNEITTALPYFVALERISEARLSLLEGILSVAFYNVIFALPLFAFLATFLAYRERFAAQLIRITRWVQIWTPRLIKAFSLGFGILLLINAAVFFL